MFRIGFDLQHHHQSFPTMFPTNPSLLLAALPGHGDGMQLDERIPRRLRQAGQGRDVFCMVKQQMADLCLVQNPLLVWPEALLPTAEAMWNRVNTTQFFVQQSLDEERAEELKKLTRALERDFPNLHRTIHYYKALVAGNKPRHPYSRLKFIEAGPNAIDRVADVQMGDRPPPPKPRQLQVVFHRGWILSNGQGWRPWEGNIKGRWCCCCLQLDLSNTDLFHIQTW